MSDTIFEDKEALFKVWIEERRSRDFQTSLMWENVKYFSTLISTLITADVVLLRILMDVKVLPWLLVLFLSLILPILIISTSILGERELKRRWKRILETIANCAKIESLLGLDEDISDKLKGRMFSQDRYLFPRWVESRRKYQSSSSFIEGELKGYNMYTHMRKIYFITFFLGLLLIFIHVMSFLTINY